MKIGRRLLLTEREREIVRHVAIGLSNRDIGFRLGIGTGTVKSHVHKILKKLDFDNRTELAMFYYTYKK